MYAGGHLQELFPRFSSLFCSPFNIFTSENYFKTIMRLGLGKSRFVDYEQFVWEAKKPNPGFHCLFSSRCLHFSLDKLNEKERLLVGHTQGIWYEVGSVGELREVENLIRNGARPMGTWATNVGQRSQLKGILLPLNYGFAVIKEFLNILPVRYYQKPVTYYE